MKDNIRPLVTIATPTYNRANTYLKQSLESAVNQTYQNIEIIVSDNCSTDNTEMVVKSFNDSRIKYFRQKENIGADNNFNFCIEQANGIYFLLLHDDDLIDKDFIEVCMDAVNDSDNTGIILTGVRAIDDEGNIIYKCHNTVRGLSTEDFFLGWFVSKVPLFLCSTLYNTRRLKEIGGFLPKNPYQDVVVEAQLAFKFNRVDVYDIKASFRIHKSNKGSAIKVIDWCEGSLYLLNIICNLASEKKDLIMDKGMTYFCVRNYKHAAGIKSPLKRFSTYLMVYKKFNYCYSPIYFVYYRNVKPRIYSIKRKVKQALFCNKS